MGVYVFEGQQVFKYLLVRLSKEKKKKALGSTAALALLYESAFDSAVQDGEADLLCVSRSFAELSGDWGISKGFCERMNLQMRYN